ncbi:unnamed protein product [Pleuronectes platessa]|uniref:Uncharacterized protein n=1 Tax=Pleuronectes platessa TaxID=8262 RepID=A0A9N7VEH9_PLEPL|nr:unnamed protein product [Pleuronectes platessa]
MKPQSSELSTTMDVPDFYKQTMDMKPTEGAYDYYDYDESENSTMCDYSEWTPSYSVIPVLYMLIFILGLSGNGVVIFTVWRAQGQAARGGRLHREPGPG